MRRKSDAFGERVERFRAFFQQRAPFAPPGGGHALSLEQVGRGYAAQACSASLASTIACGQLRRQGKSVALPCPLPCAPQVSEAYPLLEGLHHGQASAAAQRRRACYHWLACSAGHRHQRAARCPARRWRAPNR